MKHHLLFFLFLSLSTTTYAQSLFEAGYFIDNTGKRTEILLKNIDWWNNPIEIEYKLLNSNESQVIGIQEIGEFGILNKLQYIRTTVAIDRSSSVTNNLSEQRSAELVEEQLFLKKLVSGNAHLYSYKEGNLQRYFYQLGDGDITQLIYKKYAKDDGLIRENTRYKQQLFNEFKCDGITKKTIDFVGYTAKQLTKFVVKYNKCKGGSVIDFEQNDNEDLFDLSIRSGARLSSFSVRDGGQFNESFGLNIELQVGIETEITLPYWNNRFALLAEPTFRQIKKEMTTARAAVGVSYSSVEVPIGMRYYFKNNGSSKSFINAVANIDAAFNSKVYFANNLDNLMKDSGLTVNPRITLGIGVGHKYQDRLSIEVRYNLRRDGLSQYAFWTMPYTSLALIFGYTLF